MESLKGVCSIIPRSAPRITSVARVGGGRILRRDVSGRSAYRGNADRDPSSDSNFAFSLEIVAETRHAFQSRLRRRRAELQWISSHGSKSNRWTMNGEPNSEVLLGQLRAGDRRAADAIFQRFARRLVGMARGRLDGRLRQKVDAEDVVQSVFRSFFERSERGEFDFANWEGVWGILVLLTVRKCGRRIRHFQADRRDARREVAGHGEDFALDAYFIEAIADEPTPEEAMLLAETTEEVFLCLRGDKERRIFELSMQGYSIPEISAMVGHYERGVEQVRSKIKKRLETMLAET